MKREVRAVLLVLVGAAVLHLSLLSDAYLRYVRASMRPYLVAAGLVLLLLGLVRTVTAVRLLLREGGGRGRRARPRPHPEAPPGADGTHREGGEQGEDDGHGHGAHGPRIAWLLVLPVLTILLVSPPALGTYTAQHSSDAVAEPAAASGFPPLPAGDPLVLPIADFEVRAVWDASGSLRGRTVQLTGFTVRGTQGRWYLSRLTITCCAADAVTYKVEVRGIAAPPQGSWVKVTGSWLPQGPIGRDGTVPVLSAVRATGITQPANPYD